MYTCKTCGGLFQSLTLTMNCNFCYQIDENKYQQKKLIEEQNRQAELNRQNLRDIERDRKKYEDQLRRDREIEERENRYIAEQNRVQQEYDDILKRGEEKYNKHMAFIREKEQREQNLLKVRLKLDPEFAKKYYHDLNEKKKYDDYLKLQSKKQNKNLIIGSIIATLTMVFWIPFFDSLFKYEFLKVSSMFIAIFLVWFIIFMILEYIRKVKNPKPVYVQYDDQQIGF